MATEKRLIDANELLELYDMGEELEGYASALSVPIPVIRQNIKDMPTVDAVEVVRCRDCKHCEHGYKCRMPLGAGLYDNYYIMVDDDDFCSYGERE